MGLPKRESLKQQTERLRGFKLIDRTSVVGRGGHEKGETRQTGIMDGSEDGREGKKDVTSPDCVVRIKKKTTLQDVSPSSNRKATLIKRADGSAPLL